MVNYIFDNPCGLDICSNPLPYTVNIANIFLFSSIHACFIYVARLHLTNCQQFQTCLDGLCRYPLLDFNPRFTLHHFIDCYLSIGKINRIEMIADHVTAMNNLVSFPSRIIFIWSWLGNIIIAKDAQNGKEEISLVLFFFDPRSAFKGAVSQCPLKLKR